MNYVYEVLETEMEYLLAAIAGCTDLEKKAELIGSKVLVEHSIKLLKKCDFCGISSGSIFTVLPQKICDTPSSDYRVIEDGETDDPKYWQEVRLEGKSFNCVRLSEGDVVIEN